MSPIRTETFEPEDLASLGSIFDQAWASVAASYEHTDEDTRAAARARLARILLQLAARQVGTESLKQVAVRAFLQIPASFAPASDASTDAPLAVSTTK
jgi:hypothetical protein